MMVFFFGLDNIILNVFFIFGLLLFRIFIWIFFVVFFVLKIICLLFFLKFNLDVVVLDIKK